MNLRTIVSSLASQQFGKGSLEWIGMKRLHKDEARDRTGRHYHMHQEGDRDLREIAHILKETSRESDVVARLGGDEFVVFYESNSTNNAEMIEKRLTQALSKINEDRKKSRAISISMGLVAFSGSNRDSIDEMLHKAELIIYEQKRKKRERSGPAAEAV